MNAIAVRSQGEDTSRPFVGASLSTVEKIRIRYEKSNASQAFTGSLRLILEAIQRDQAADAVSLYEYIAPGMLLLRETAGKSLDRLETANLQLSHSASVWLRDLTAIEEIRKAQEDFRVTDFPEVLLHQLKTLAVAPVRDGEDFRGLLTLGWKQPSPETPRPSTASLEALVDAAYRLLIRREEASAALDLVSEIAKLEADLADLKIAERAKGYVNGDRWAQQTAFDIQEHVSRILEGADINRNLREQLAHLQSRLQDRQLLAQAKTRLQSALGMNEENAYIYLRNTSRRMRRPLREIAEQVLRADTVSRHLGSSVPVR